MEEGYRLVTFWERLLGVVCIMAGLIYFIYRYKYYKDHKEITVRTYEKAREYAVAFLMLAIGLSLLFANQIKE